jgi:hypothetical protein
VPFIKMLGERAGCIGGISDYLCIDQAATAQICLSLQLTGKLPSGGLVGVTLFGPPFVASVDMINECDVPARTFPLTVALALVNTGHLARLLLLGGRRVPQFLATIPSPQESYQMVKEFRKNL